MTLDFWFKTLWPVLLIVGIAGIITIAIKVIPYLIERKKLLKLGIKDIDNIDGKTFEKYLEVMFRSKGYSVTRTKYQGDFGGDLIIQKEGSKKVIQAKRWKRKVGVKAIQEVTAARGYYKCNEAMVITNSYFTKEALKLAKANNIETWDRKKLIDNLTKTKITPPTYAQKSSSANLRDRK